MFFSVFFSYNKNYRKTKSHLTVRSNPKDSFKKIIEIYVFRLHIILQIHHDATVTFFVSFENLTLQAVLCNSRIQDNKKWSRKATSVRFWTIFQVEAILCLTAKRAYEMTDDLNLNAGPTFRSVFLFASKIYDVAVNRSF